MGIIQKECVTRVSIPNMPTQNTHIATITDHRIAQQFRNLFLDWFTMCKMIAVIDDLFIHYTTLAFYSTIADMKHMLAIALTSCELHREMDEAVASAYGWHDLVLGHGFHETKQWLRYTISEEARREVFSKLLALNHERYAEEVA